MIDLKNFRIATARAALDLDPPVAASAWLPAGVERFSAQSIELSLVYMLQHLDEPLRVSTLSAIAKVSRSQFYALFKRTTGDTPINFLIRARMRHACKLLLDTGLPVKEVAAALGYHDELYFSRVFKSVCGLAPSHYRARMRQTARPAEAAPRAASPVAT